MARLPSLRLALVGLLAGSIAVAEEPRFILLDDQTTKVESCPLRVELPLAPLFAGKLPYRTAKPSRVQCEGVFISLVTTERHPPKGGRQGRVYAQARVFQPSGYDREFLISYTLMDGVKVLATNRELMGADAGAVNWEDGVSLFYPPASDPGMRASLRIEVVPTDEAPGAKMGGCTTDQILKMKAAGVSDEQVKTICGG